MNRTDSILRRALASVRRVYADIDRVSRAMAEFEPRPPRRR